VSDEFEDVRRDGHPLMLCAAPCGGGLRLRELVRSEVARVPAL
jgi:hypothetical protein